MMFTIGVVARLIAQIVLLGPVTFVRGSEVRGFLGQSITLPCSYSVRVNGETKMCWGRGWCTRTYCSETLVTTNGKAVTSTISPKYHLDGKIEEGDVSLTVDNLGEEDGGRYCCRVQIRGLFNDQIDYSDLLILEAPSPVMTPPITDVTHTTEHGNKFSSSTNSPSISPTKQNSTQTPHSTVNIRQRNYCHDRNTSIVLKGLRHSPG
ncbi:hepatitis A virus cellular receptor 1 homolog isoform X2 [Scyliorhinus canicula]|uniref:hepatitis A virus cellular receptor 1 homolog isoform X2 n=1 Tax=Scyliorhinus canicula TaxID=7830 RepID=UPI0018F4C949|nr:hepatitis A virus cellular receptor 1 homolog isoform X2 [Scyliorhinus canicula]